MKINETLKKFSSFKRYIIYGLLYRLRVAFEELRKYTVSLYRPWDRRRRQQMLLRDRLGKIDNHTPMCIIHNRYITNDNHNILSFISKIRFHAKTIIHFFVSKRQKHCPVLTKSR